MFHIPFLNLSPVALLAGIAAHMLIGMAWYSSILFGSRWVRLQKIKAGSFVMDTSHWVGAALTGATITIVLNHLLQALGTHICLQAIEYALLLWLGFIAPIQFSGVLWEKKPLELYFISIGHWAVTLALIGCIVTKL